MENYNLHRRAQSGWHPTTYSRKPMPDAPRERKYEAILAAAKRPPVGYYEDAPRGIQFGGVAERPIASAPKSSGSASASREAHDAGLNPAAPSSPIPDGARAWKNHFHWLSIGVKWFAASPIGGWEQYPDNWLAGSAMTGWVEQSPAEVQRLVDECMAAMKGK